MKKSVSMIGVLVAASFTACAPQDDSTTAVTDPLVGGSATWVRPEVGQLVGAGCTATLVDAQYVITAAHCFNFAYGSVNDTFQMSTTTGAQVLPASKVDYLYTTDTNHDGPNGDGLGDYDFAFGRLSVVVDGATAFPALIGVAPVGNEQVSAFGYGCTGRPNDGNFAKRFVDYTFGDNTQMNCPGDSGGPRFHGFHTGSGAIWGINSGYNNGSGNDLLATAWAFAPVVLRGVRSFGGTTVTNLASSTFAGLTQQSGVKVVAGDFDGNGTGDLAAVGGAGWTTVPMVSGTGLGGFTFTNASLANFPSWATQAKSVVAADFDGDGATDIALLGGPWTSIPIAFSNRDGTFHVTNQVVPNLPAWAQLSGVKAVAGDFDADGDGDIALVGGAGWASVPMGFSNRDGTFVQTNTSVASFPGFAQQAGAQPFAGDFDGDGDADIALTGPPGWSSVPIAFSNRMGGFSVTNTVVDDFPTKAGTTGAKIAVGDFDGDGDADLAAIGASGWRSLHFALSNGSGGFLPAYLPNPDFAQFATAAPIALGVRANKDVASDLVVTGGAGVQTVPIAFVKASRIVSQSSTAFGATADRANDGNTDGNYFNGSVTHTASESQPWWRADLRVLTHISQVWVYNRSDCCGDRLTNFNVSISSNGSTWTTVNVPGQGGRPTMVSFDAWARYIRIQLTGTNNLSLAEVSVIE